MSDDDGAHLGPARILADTAALADATGETHASGAVWRLDVPERHLDANVIALPGGDEIQKHRGPAVDVLIHVISGSGQLHSDGETLVLRPGLVVWLPRFTHRHITADHGGLRYLSVHQRKSGLQIGSGPPQSQ